MKSNDGLQKKLEQIHQNLEQNYGENLSKSIDSLDKLYAILQEVVPCGDTQISLNAAEELKYAYGLCQMQNKLRLDECTYWRKIALLALASKQFQVLEYLLEGAKILYKAFNEQKTVLIDTFKILVDATVKEEKFFISANIVNILVVVLKKLDDQPDTINRAVISCLTNVGCLAIHHKEEPLFQELCLLLVQNLKKVDAKQEVYIDKMLSKWLNQMLKDDSAQAFVIWLKLFGYYKKIRVNLNNDFYANLVQILSMYSGKVNGNALQKINRYLIRCSFTNKNQMQKILTITTFANAYKKTLNNFGWQMANYVYDSLYLDALCIVDKIYIKNKVDACDRAIFDIYLETIKKAAAFCAITMPETTVKDVFDIWKQVLLFKYKSVKSKKRVDKLFELLEAS